jgi:hypothetical protein
MAFEKWLELCETPEEANEAYQNVPTARQHVILRHTREQKN